jgi:hypothetical protein
MGKVSAGLFVTLDGVAEAPERWNPPYFDGEMAQELGSTMSAADALLLGRVTFEEWAAFWPAQSPEENPMAALINKQEEVRRLYHARERGVGELGARQGRACDRGLEVEGSAGREPRRLSLREHHARPVPPR